MLAEAEQVTGEGAGLAQLSVGERRALSLARRLLERRPLDFGLPAGWRVDDRGGVFTAVATAIRSLRPEARDRLRELVRWLVDYERAERAAES